jgi:hypothetical protein
MTRRYGCLGIGEDPYFELFASLFTIFFFTRIFRELVGYLPFLISCSSFIFSSIHGSKDEALWEEEQNVGPCRLVGARFSKRLTLINHAIRV